MIKPIAQTCTWALRMGCFIHLVHSSLYEVTETYGESMVPTLACTGDFVHVNKLYLRGKNCQLGDIIVASKPTMPSQRVCKRITGMPGDFVLIEPQTTSKHMIQVPEGHCWVTGDNLSQSIDSRTYGPLPLALIRGKVVGIHAGWYYRNINNTN